MKDMFKQATTALLLTGAMLSCPVFAEAEAQSSNTETVQTITQINLNTASAEQLIQLPGIGPKKAQAIIDYREQYGEFLLVEDIQNVKGIGKKAFARLESMLKV